MKIKLSLLFILTLTILQGCKKDVDTVQSIGLTYQLTVDPNSITFKVPFEKANIVLTNKLNNEKYTAKATSDGKVQFAGITPGTYSVNVSLVLTAAEVSTLTGLAISEELHLNYSMDNQMYVENHASDVQLVSSAPLGNWVFKQIYYAGSNTSKGAGVRDFFCRDL